MKLIDHIRLSGKTVTGFASEIGVADTTIRKIVYNQRQPSLTLAVKISQATGGAVTEADLMQPKSAAA